MSWALHPLQINESLNSTVHLSFEFMLMCWGLLMMLIVHSSCSNYRMHMHVPPLFIHLSLDFSGLSFGLRSCSWLLIGLLIVFDFTLQAWPPTPCRSNGSALRGSCTSHGSSLRPAGQEEFIENWWYLQRIVGMVTDNFFFFFFFQLPINYTEYNLSITIKRNNEAVAVLASSKCGGG